MHNHDNGKYLTLNGSENHIEFHALQVSPFRLTAPIAQGDHGRHYMRIVSASSR
jgi:hypothetical protein